MGSSGTDASRCPTPRPTRGCSWRSGRRGGKSDRQVAEARNAAGYRTSGNRGPQPLHQGHRLPPAAEPLLPGRAAGRGGGMRSRRPPARPRRRALRAGEEARAANRRAWARSASRGSDGPIRCPGLGTAAGCGGRLHVMTDRHGKARVYCYRRQAKSCGQRSVMLEVVEDQIAAYLASFRLPRRRWPRSSGCTRGRGPARRRRAAAAEIASRIERLPRCTGGGDLTREAYRASGSTWRRSWRLRGRNRAVLLAQAAAFLRDLRRRGGGKPRAAQRPGRLVFESVEIATGGSSPWCRSPDFAPFFLARRRRRGCSSPTRTAPRATPSSEVMNGRKRRGSGPRARALRTPLDRRPGPPAPPQAGFVRNRVPVLDAPP
jgi:hypothetical protein